jgi:hypothetical protein
MSEWSSPASHLAVVVSSNHLLVLRSILDWVDKLN